MFLGSSELMIGNQRIGNAAATVTFRPSWHNLIGEINRKRQAGVDGWHLTLLLHPTTAKALIEEIFGRPVEVCSSGLLFGCMFQTDKTVPENKCRVLMGNEVVAEWSLC